METLINGVCALIPDGLETWLGQGGNVTVIVGILAAYAFASMLRPPAGVPRGGRPADAAESETDTTDAEPVR